MITGGDGDIDMSMSPAITARAAAVPLSNGRSSTLAPYFLNSPTFSAVSGCTVVKIGGMPGMPITTFLPWRAPRQC